MKLMAIVFFVAFGFTETVQKVEVTRFSDKVIIKDGETGKEVTKFYTNKMSLCSVGDRVRQGSGAISECRFEDDGLVRFFARARYRFAEMTDGSHVIDVEEFTRIKVRSKENITFLLPGGSRLVTEKGDCFLVKEESLIHIRNEGYNEAKLSGHLVVAENEVIPAGHTISIPIFAPELGEEADPVVVREVGGIIVKTTGGYCFEEHPGSIMVSRPGLEDGLALVGGARIFLEPGEQIKLKFPQR